MMAEANQTYGSAADSLPQTLSAADRTRAFRSARRHTYLVRILKIALPTVSVCVLALYFVTSSISFSVGDLNASVGKIEVSRDGLRMINPRLEGFTDKNGRYVVVADDAVQSLKNPDLIGLNSIDARLTDKDRSWSRVLAARGSFHTKKEILQLRGGIKVTSSTGMNADLDSADLNMKKNSIVSQSPVVVTMTTGRVKANRMVINTKTRKILFDGAVRVHISRNSTKRAMISGSGFSPNSNTEIQSEQKANR